MKVKTEKKFIRFFKDLYEHLLTRGIKPEYMQLENEASPYFQRYLLAKDIDLQTTPTLINHHNLSEHKIRTFKSHLIYGLCSIDT